MSIRPLAINERNDRVRGYCETLERAGWIPVEQPPLMVQWRWMCDSEAESFTTLDAMATLHIHNGTQLEWAKDWCRVARYCLSEFELID